MSKLPDTTIGKMRLDKWLWAARFYKSRGQSSEEIDRGRVLLNGQTCKPSKDVKVGDTLEIHSGPVVKTVVLRALTGVRGPAPAAALLYDETSASVALRLAAAESLRMAPEPAWSQAQGRPTKRDRRDIEALRGSSPFATDWDNRWSASLDD